MLDLYLSDTFYMYDKKIQCKFTFSNAKKLLDVNVYMDK